MFGFPRRAFAVVALTVAVLVASGVWRVASAGDFGVLRVVGPGVTTALQLTVDDLEAMGPVTLTTVTMWDDEPIVFRGLPLSTILAAAGAHGTVLRAEALNDYFVDVAIDNALGWGAFVAFEADGARMPVRDRGPYWIVYPWSERPELRNGEVEMTSVWQLTQLEVR